MTSAAERRQRRKESLARDFAEIAPEETKQSLVASFIELDAELAKQQVIQSWREVASDIEQASIVAAWMADEESDQLALTDELLNWCADNEQALTAASESLRHPLAVTASAGPAAAQSLRVAAHFEVFDQDRRRRRRAALMASAPHVEVDPITASVMARSPNRDLMEEGIARLARVRQLMDEEEDSFFEGGP